MSIKRLFCTFLATVFFVLNFYIKSFALCSQNIGFEPACTSVLLMNLDTNSVVYEKNPDQKLPIASTTKIMTAILTLENIKDIETTSIKVKRELIRSLDGTGSSLSGIEVGKEYTILQLLHCLLISSGNDAALVLADYVGGNISNFVNMMNQRAKDLGCLDTNFVNPHGLDAENHYSSAKDLAKIQMHAMTLPYYNEITSTVVSKILDKHLLVTRNSLIDPVRGGKKYYYKYATSGKTGSEKKAGKCLVSVAQNQKYKYLCVALGGFSENDDNVAMLDSKALFAWAFDNLELKTVATRSKPLGEIKLHLAWNKKSLLLTPAKDCLVMLPKDVSPQSIDYKLNIPAFVNAPIKAGQVIGTATLSYANTPVASIDLISEQNIKKSNILFILNLIKIALNSILFKIALGVFLVLLILYFMLFVKQNKRKRRRRSARCRRYDF